MFSCCICCKRSKSQKNELLGLEGKVKMKNPDEVVVVTTMGPSESSQADLNTSISNADSDKRASTAAHRSLPDIPIAETNGDTGSELYETVAEKHLLEQQASQDRSSPVTSLKKLASVSQHSSISQADDFSSPYSRVKNSPHGYAKVRSTEHPYAQVNPPPALNASSTTSGSNLNVTALNNSRTGASSRCSQHHNGSTQDLNESNTSQVEIPAASAIAGMISASQDLPYMTPPIANQHFSGDSQDSSKGYTSISVREPLANILAQQPTTKTTLPRNVTTGRDVGDSHYATVSDDSDETYAAIEDPNLRNNPNVATDIYTSGSETYAQIQPMQSFVVSVEINNATDPQVSVSEVESNNNLPNSSSVQPQQQQQQHAAAHQHLTPKPPVVDSLRSAQLHTRQASSSSNNSSSVANLGSPKPEKRQANSPLPPTPKSSTTLNITNNQNSNQNSSRNSVISVIDFTNTSGMGQIEDPNNPPQISTENSPLKKTNKSLSPSKDIENMYAKVMKKNKFSTRNSPPSNNNSPIMTRKYNENSTDMMTSLGISPLDSSAADILESHKIIISSSSSSATTVNTNNENRIRSNSYGANDHGYETIPADANRKSDGCYAHILQKDRQLEGNASSTSNSLSTGALNTAIRISADEGEQQLHEIDKNTNTSYEKHYETIPGAGGDNFENSTNSDPGYETLLKTNKNQSQSSETDIEKRSDYDPNYEVLRGPNNPNSAGLSDDGYAKVLEKTQPNVDGDSTDGYSKVKGEETEDGYSTIREFKDGATRADSNHNYASISEAKSLSSDVNSKSHQNLSVHLTTISAASTPVRSLGESISVDSLRQPIRSSELATMTNSPSSYNSSSLLNNSSATSATNITTTSTRSTLSSSRQTPSSSQYESFTGSDTDPNYESVNYSHSKTLTRSTSDDVNHPYERLVTEITSPLTSSASAVDRNQTSSSTSLDAPMQYTRPTTVTVLSTSSNITTIKTGNGAAMTQQTIISSSETAVVDDYFQV